MISVIIPTFNEENRIANLIKYLTTHGQGSVEIIIVDGGSTDATVVVAKKARAKVLQFAERSRAGQMNYGAKSASNNILYFLHADTYPPQSFCADILKALNDGYDSGCFRLSFDNDHPILKFYCWFTRFDVNIFRFGDQSLYVNKMVFEQVGGFDERLILMEDQEIIRTLKKVSKFNIINNLVTTSARKYENFGIIKLQVIFTSVLCMYYLRVDHQKIVNYYNHKIR